MSRGRQLLRNAVFLFLGNIGARMMAIVLVPLYTRALTPEEYGTVELVLTTLDLLMPVLFLSLHEAVLRRVMLDAKDGTRVLTTALLSVTIGSLMIGGLGVAFGWLSPLGSLLWYATVILILQGYHGVLGAWARATDRVGLFATSGWIQALTLGLLNIVLLLILNWGTSGFLISVVVSYVAAIAVLAAGTRVWRSVALAGASRKLFGEMLRYSAPLIPNVVMWWLVSISNRYFLLALAGVDVVGEFAVASRIALLLTVITTVFAQAWQLSAFTEYSAADRSRFFSRAHSSYLAVLAVSAVLLISMAQPAMRLLDPRFHEAWRFVPGLLLAAVFSALAAFVGTVFTAAERTMGILTTSAIGGLVAVGLNWLLVGPWGGVGASLAAAVSFAVMWVLRLRGTSRYVTWELGGVRSVATLLVLVAHAVAVVLLPGDLAGPVGGVVALGLVCLLQGSALRAVVMGTWAAARRR